MSNIVDSLLAYLRESVDPDDLLKEEPNTVEAEEDAGIPTELETPSVGDQEVNAAEGKVPNPKDTEEDKIKDMQEKADVEKSPKQTDNPDPVGKAHDEIAKGKGKKLSKSKDSGSDVVTGGKIEKEVDKLNKVPDLGTAKTKESKVTEQMPGEAPKISVLAKGISDKEVANRIAQTKNGAVVTDADDETKFMVVTKESKVTEATPENNPETASPGVDAPDINADATEPKVSKPEEEAPAPKGPQAVKDDAEGEREYLGQKGDMHYYIIRVRNDAGDLTDLEVQDAEENKVFTAVEQEADLEDMKQFVINTVRELALDLVSYDILQRYGLLEDEPDEADLEADDITVDGQKQGAPLEPMDGKNPIKQAGIPGPTEPNESKSDEACSGKKKMKENILNEGQFSWIDPNTREPIYSDEGHQKTVYMLDDKGNKWQEDAYEGYGIFGGKDFYELLAEMNGITEVPEGVDDLRSAGIDLAFPDDDAYGDGTNAPGVKYPKLTSNPNAVYDDVPNPERDPNQGWYQGEDEDDDDYGWGIDDRDRDDESIVNEEDRQSFVDNCVNVFKAPNGTVQQKIAFMKSKGATDDEITNALNIATGGEVVRAALDGVGEGMQEGKDERGKRDGTGPYKGSAQRQIRKDGKGKRKAQGQKCPAESNEGSAKGLSRAEVQAMTDTELEKELKGLKDASTSKFTTALKGWLEDELANRRNECKEMAEKIYLANKLKEKEDKTERDLQLIAAVNEEKKNLTEAQRKLVNEIHAQLIAHMRKTK